MSKARKASAKAAPRLVDGAGLPVTLGPEIGRGGEGAVHATEDEEGVAKVYADAGKARPDKLAAMIPMAPRMDAFAAWPRDVLRDEATGRVVGFTMRRATGRHDIHDLYNVKSRRNNFPKADWRFLVHVGTNLCRAFCASPSTEP
jgi:DNA-binding helix-hairpin-helix protein with protein kinase domain